MEMLEERFVALWNAGVKFSEIEEQLNLDHNGVSYLRRSLHVKPRRDLDAQKSLRNEVWDMVQKRVPIKIIAKEKGVTETYVRQTINKLGYSVRDFYDRPIREKRTESPSEPKDGVKCTESVMHKCIYGTHDCCMYCVIEMHSRPCPPENCTCFQRRPKGFKQRSWTFT